MNPIWTVLLVSVGVPLATLVANMRINRKTLAASQAKVDAEVLDLGLGTQNKVMDRIEADNERLGRRVEVLERGLENAAEQTRSLVEAAKQAQREAQEARAEAEQAREETRIARAETRQAREETRIAREEMKVATDHIEVLVLHIRATREWITKYAASHPPPSAPPPEMPPFIN